MKPTRHGWFGLPDDPADEYPHDNLEFPHEGADDDDVGRWERDLVFERSPLPQLGWGAVLR